jgi:cysteine-rich repeat protein
MCKWRSLYRSRESISVHAWVASLAMLAACGYPPLDSICGDQFCLSQQICAAKQDVCIDPGGCGDGVIDPGEVCDDGNIMDGDGCSADCHSDETCGNGIIDKHSSNPEECDDGKLNGTTDDICDITCHKFCGDGIVDQSKGEQCDPGAMDSADCNSSMAAAVSCKIAKCGDGYTNMVAKEQCDSGNVDTAMCNSKLCTLAACGDSYINMIAGEQCENGGLDTTTCNGMMAGAVSCHTPHAAMDM